MSPAHPHLHGSAWNDLALENVKFTTRKCSCLKLLKLVSLSKTVYSWANDINGVTVPAGETEEWSRWWLEPPMFLMPHLWGRGSEEWASLWWEGMGKAIRQSWAVAVGLLWGAPGWRMKFVQIRSFLWIVTSVWGLSHSRAIRSHLQGLPRWSGG